MKQIMTITVETAIPQDEIQRIISRYESALQAEIIDYARFHLDNFKSGMTAMDISESSNNVDDRSYVRELCQSLCRRGLLIEDELDTYAPAFGIYQKNHKYVSLTEMDLVHLNDGGVHEVEGQGEITFHKGGLMFENKHDKIGQSITANCIVRIPQKEFEKF